MLKSIPPPKKEPHSKINLWLPSFNSKKNSCKDSGWQCRVRQYFLLKFACRSRWDNN